MSNEPGCVHLRCCSLAAACERVVHVLLFNSRVCVEFVQLAARIDLHAGVAEAVSRRPEISRAERSKTRQQCQKRGASCLAAVSDHAWLAIVFAVD